MSDTIRLAIQRSGRLSKPALRLIEESGIAISGSSRSLRYMAKTFPLELLFLRDDDIPGYVADGVADAGIVGQNVTAEKGVDVVPVLPLGFGQCRLSLAIPKSVPYAGIEDLAGKRIATSYPTILGNFLREAGVDAHIHEISGSVEIAPGIGLADAICDLVSTGSTLLSNGLKETERIFESEAELVRNPDLSSAKLATLERLVFRIKSVLKAESFKYIVLNVPTDAVDRVAELLPGMKSPSVIPLADPGWCAMQSVVAENEYWAVIEQLKEAGAQGILVVPIEKMVS